MKRTWSNSEMEDFGMSLSGTLELEWFRCKAVTEEKGIDLDFFMSAGDDDQGKGSDFFYTTDKTLVCNCGGPF
ncbi:hypothetical protein HCH29_03465 [Enterococcus gilvus]|nr:hypothetical protein [Enterococcus gilvus]